MQPHDDAVSRGAGAGEWRVQAPSDHDAGAHLVDRRREDRRPPRQSILDQRADITRLRPLKNVEDLPSGWILTQPLNAFAPEIPKGRLAAPVRDDEVGKESRRNLRNRAVPDG